MLEQMLDEMTYDGLANNSLPYHEYSAVNKLVSWVQQVRTDFHSYLLCSSLCLFSKIIMHLFYECDVQFTSMSINKQAARRPHPILAPSPATAARKTRELAATAATASTNNTNTVTAESLTVSGPDIGTLPVKKRVIPSASLQLVPFYSEVDSTLYKTPLLIALLGSFEKKSSFLSQRKPRPPRSGKFTEDEVDDLDRLVVKVYDVLGTAEYHHTVIIREYVIFLSELEEDYHNLAHKYFQPEDREWWAAHIKEVLVVQPKPQNKLKLFVSRKAIEQIVADGVASGVDPKPLVKMTTSPTPIATLADADASKKNDTATKEGESKKNKEPKTKPAAVGAPSDRLTAPKTNAALGSVKVPPNLSSKASQPSKESAPSSKVKGTKPESFPATAAPLAPVVTDKKPREGSAPSKKMAALASAPVPAATRAASSAAAAPAKAIASNASTKESKESAPNKATTAQGKPVAASAKVKPVAPTAKASVAPGTKSMKAVIPSPKATPGSAAFAAPAAAVTDLEITVEIMNISPPAHADTTQRVETNPDEEVVVANAIGGGDAADYNEDFEADSVAAGNAPANTATTAEEPQAKADNGNTVVVSTASEPVTSPPAVTVGVSTRGTTSAGAHAADYDEDFEEEASLENGTNVDDANTTDAVHSNADTYSYSNQDTTKSATEAGNNKDADARYYSDFEENSVGAASGVIIDDQSSYNNVGEEINGGDRPLSMIEAAQREFDEIGEDDGVFFNSVDDEDF